MKRKTFIPHCVTLMVAVVLLAGCPERHEATPRFSSLPVAPSGALPLSAASHFATPPVSVARMVPVPAGTFRMHDSEWHAGQEVTVHEPSLVTVSSFDLDATEVTVGAYLQCVKSGACDALRPDFTSNPACPKLDPGMAEHPMECLTWFEATAYCHSQGKRLPSEIEWEYAARGGAKGSDYPWGNDDPSSAPARLCWTGGGAVRMETCPVASFPAEAFGTFDLAGNVAEWTSTVEAPAPADDATSHFYRVVRGGAAGTNVARSIVAHRLEDPSYHSGGIGMRCARDASRDTVTH